MKTRRSRFALMGVLTLVLALTVGLMSGSVADAKKKKKKKKGGGAVTLTAPATAIPPAVESTPQAEGRAGFVSIPLMVGGKAKGKVVGWDSVIVTSTFTGATNDALQAISAELTAPNGRTVNLINPVSDAFLNPGGGNTVSGPLTETPNSPNNICLSDPGPPPNPPCFNPESVVGPPYAGTVGNNGLENFGGVPAKGTWTLKLFNGSATTTAVMNSAVINITLKAAPAA